MDAGAGTSPLGRRFLAAGESLIDLIVADGAPTLEQADVFAARPGGAPANVAVALARLGLPAAFLGVVGADPFGRRLRQALRDEQVDVSRLAESSDAATTLAFAWKDEAGDGHFWLLRAADTRLDAAAVERARIGEAAVLVVGSVALSAEPSRSAIGRAVAIAAESGVPVCFDVNLRPTLWRNLGEARVACWEIAGRATLLKLSLDDARGLFAPEVAPDDVFAAVRRIAPGAFVVLTDGARGAWFAAAREIVHIPALPVAAIEPTGAGDAFTAALLLRLADNGWTGLAEADVRYASAAGALATTRPGAWEGLPTAAELASFLARHG